MVVVDTNVPITANDVDSDCGRACVAALESAMAGVVCIDEGLRILQEYINNVELPGQPGVGHAFVRRLHQMQAVETVCRQVRITPCHGSNEAENYVEFPGDPDLERFDPSDRKFDAVVIASGVSPPVLNATDSDWWDDRVALHRNGVVVQFLCPERFEGRGAV